MQEPKLYDATEDPMVSCRNCGIPYPSRSESWYDDETCIHCIRKLKDTSLVMQATEE